VDMSPVDTARRVAGSKVVCSRVSVGEGQEAEGGVRLVGERKKSRDQDLFGAVASAVVLAWYPEEGPG
jgi:hypothetical protein